MLRRQLVPVLTLVVGALALGGCGSSSTSGTGGAGGATGGAGGATGGAGGATGGAGGATGGAGGATGGAGGATGGAGGTPNLGMCPGAGNTCTKAEIDSQNACLVSKCESAYVPCVGAGWKTGQFGGMCGTYFKCVNDCGCGNFQCLVACGLPPGPCITCLETASQCQTSMCPQPACYGSQPDGGATIPDGGLNFSDGGFNFDGFTLPDLGNAMSCSDLQKCCDALPATSPFKASCSSAASGMSDQTCAATLIGLKALNMCP